MSPYIWLGLLVIVGGALMFIGDKLETVNSKEKIFRPSFTIFLAGMCLTFGGGSCILCLLVKHF